MTLRRYVARVLHAAVGAIVWLSVAASCNVSAAQDTVPAGFGTLKRDDVVVRFATDQIEIQVLPLAEGVIRLLAPDTYRSLKSLLRSRDREIRQAAQRAGVERPTLVMVTFFGVLPGARFSPEDLNLTNQGRLFRPVGIVALSPRWGSYQLDAREQAVAIYLFEEGVAFREGLTVSYQELSSEAWTAVLPTLEREWARVRARASVQQSP